MSFPFGKELPDREIRELVEAAVASPALVSARKLAEWVGTGRPLTTRNVLKPAVAVEVCDLLGIELPSRKPRSAMDIDELMLVWSTALAARFLEISPGRVRAGKALELWVAEEPDPVLTIWAACTTECLGLAGDTAVDLEQVAVLAELHERDGSASLRNLGEAINEVDGSAPACDCPDCVVEEMWPLGGVVETLAEFGIAVLRGDSAELTPLGRWYTDFLFRHSAPAAEVNAATLLDGVAHLPPKVGVLMARPWLSARTPVVAARELLAAGEAASGQLRVIALALAGECGPEADAAWREWAAKDGFGAYARVWLAEEAGTDPAEDDDAWITVDTLAATLDALPPEIPAYVLTGILRVQAGREPAEVLPLLERSGHPAAPRLVSLLGADQSMPVVSRVPSALPAGTRYGIKVQLRGVTKPPVWRRIEVPADLDLGEFHGVLQRAMGWDDSHMHVFDDGRSEYGLPDPGLGHRNERNVRLSHVLVEVGDRLGYTYDFGDDWEHQITLEKILPPAPGVTGALCTGGKGACPPEDCGGVGGYERLKEILADPDAEEHDDMLEWLGLDSGDEFDPQGFSAEDVNRVLSRSV